MSTVGVLDDYLEQLLGDAVPDVAAPLEISAAPAAAVVAQDEAEAEGVALAISAEFAPSPEGDAAPCSADAAVLKERMNDSALDPPVETVAIAHDSPTAPGTPANLALLDELMNDPALGPPVEAVVIAHDSPTAPGSPANLALLDELMNDPALGPVMAADATSDARPGWDDLPDEVIHDTPAPVIAAAAPAPAVRPAPAPMARALPAALPMSAPSARTAAPAHTRPGSWQELQAQAHNPASSPRENRRASERTTRWLRLRCGAQAYALELLKVQEVVLPVPLLPLRGTAAAMLGIMNLRGQVVPVMDLGIHLGAGPAQDDANTRIVVLEEDGETMGLRVSAVEDVANLTESQIEPPDTARICQISNDLFRGVARVTAQPMILLDATQLLN
ncbi:chemotaxis protein CheW [Stenotrophomonas rhizophila]|uniref:chemotaxis protein CheW n=1 Tax=Stenotrophomonas rhizophila TaxID=216778 RepID=UPI001E2A34E2|nr:chemotaxis protein CheW [Stenotrophomonas rhizophila]MCC7635262.1 chemotaxis protein CheW [Stenotrophomonas rhizophila]MCC7663137.1 chemotaxis protein CheW [Stenotrophomonas rhizophila]